MQKLIDKIFDKIPYGLLERFSTSQMLGIGAGIGAGVFGLFWITVHSAQEDEYTALETKMAQVQKKLTKYQREVAQLGALILQVAQLDADLEEFKRQLPVEDELPKLINRLADAGSLLGISMNSFEIGDEVEKKTFYRTIPLTISISGGFYNTLGFFDTLQHLMQMVNVTKLKLQMKKERELGVDEEGRKTFLSTSRVFSTISALTYAYIEGSEK
ncbi:MAG: type 4a pilus biogenesis protein PilO [Nitrospinaceae bacterium]